MQLIVILIVYTNRKRMDFGSPFQVDIDLSPVRKRSRSRSRLDGHLERETSIERPKRKVLRMADMSRMVGPIRLSRKTIVLVAKHQKPRVAMRNFLSMAISMVESLMAS